MSMLRRLAPIFILIALSEALILPGQARRAADKEKTAASTLEPGVFRNLEWRNVGPAIVVGRVADVEGVPGDSRVVYVGSASGGVWKSVNAGVTWKPVFDGQSVSSIGDLALEPGNPDVVYVGTGEGNVRNSVSFGNGVYKSTDGGRSWIHLGLTDTRHITRILVDPLDTRVIYVGALGHIYGPNKERGVFVSRDGGEKWEKALYIDDRHGVSDLDLNPRNPNIVFAGMWQFERKPWTHRSGSEEGGLFRSVDGGRTWKKITPGLPKLIGRIAVKVAPSNPDVVYVMAESHEGTLFRSDDKGETFRPVSRNTGIISRGFYYTDLRIDPIDENRVYAVAGTLYVSIDAGRNFTPISRSTHVDFHALWIDPVNPNRLWQGQDGGIAVSYDRGQSWQYVNNLCAAQGYQIYADNRQPFYYVGGGFQDNGTWNGPSRSKETYGILNDEWAQISEGDGGHIIAHPDNHDLILSEIQGGGIVRTDIKTREQQSVNPQARRNDGGPVSRLKYRFNWNAPIIASPHDGKVVYFAANVVFRSADFGTTWEAISPDLTSNDPEKQKAAGGPAWVENTTAEYHCTIISLAESPLQKGLLWAGSDDGLLHVSLDSGKNWQNVTKNIPGIPAFSPVSHIEPSLSAAGTAYCAFDRHMFDDLKAHIFKTVDFGKTWTDISGNLPETAFVWVVREDTRNANLLYAGTEIGLFASLSGGKDWIRLHLKNLPPVAVHDILVHPRENDLILGTHGRGIWIFDDAAAIQGMTAEISRQPAYLFDVRPSLRFTERPYRYGIGDAVFQGSNPSYGAPLTFYLREEPKKDGEIKIEIVDDSGKVLRTLQKIKAEAGLNRVTWDLRTEGPRPWREFQAEEQELFSRGTRGPEVLPAVYKVRLLADGQAFEKTIEVKLDPTVQASLEDLKIRYDHSVKLAGLISALNDGIRFLASVKGQIQERRRTANAQAGVPGADEAALKAMERHLTLIDSFLGIVKKPEGKPFWSEGPRLSEQLESLFGALEDVNAAPTRAQTDFLGELREEFKTVMARINDYLLTSTAELNQTLALKKIPLVLVPPPVKLPEI